MTRIGNKKFRWVLGAFLLAQACLGADRTNDFSAVEPILTEHCLECHGAKDPEGGLVLESFETLMKGGELGAAIAPGRSAESLLVRMIEGRFEKEGKTKIMPPGKRKKLMPAEIQIIRAWIDSGAAGPSLATLPKILMAPHITPRVPVRDPINALAASGDLVAVARYGHLELRSAKNLATVRTLTGLEGNINAVIFSADGAQVFAAGGQPGFSGQARQWNVADGQLLHSFEGHRDAIYSLALSPDGRLLATGSYDQKIKIWDVTDGKELRTLSGHNGCVFGLCFRPDGQLLASASADRTVKLWEVASGLRRDTLSQSLKEVYTVAFSPDGQHLLAAGGDNRIRVWQVSSNGAETTNPILISKFAHEGAILSLVFSPDGHSLLSSADDRTVKFWEASQLEERLSLPRQPDWSPGLAFLANTKIVVGRVDGSLAAYELPSGKLLENGHAAGETKPESVLARDVREPDKP